MDLFNFSVLASELRFILAQGEDCHARHNNFDADYGGYSNHRASDFSQLREAKKTSTAT